MNWARMMKFCPYKNMSPERKRHANDELNFEDIAQVAVETTLKDGLHVPLIIMDGSKDRIFGSVPEMPGTHGERLQFLHTIGQLAAESGKVGKLRQVFFISEAWMSMPQDGQVPTIRPANDPNRKEVLIISGLKIEGQVKHLKLFEMLRAADGILVGLQEVMPGEKENGEIDIPLLEEFQKGFQSAFRNKLN